MQLKKEDLEKQVLLLSSMVADMSMEQEQLQAERDRLGEALGSLHAMQAAVQVDPRPQVTLAVTNSQSSIRQDWHSQCGMWCTTPYLWMPMDASVPGVQTCTWPARTGLGSTIRGCASKNNRRCRYLRPEQGPVAWFAGRGTHGPLGTAWGRKLQHSSVA